MGKTTIIPPLIAILRGIQPDEIDAHIPPLLEAGFATIEIPLNSPNWETSLQQAVKHYGKHAHIGGGTVLNVEHVQRLADYGCDLVVAPNTNPSVIRHSLKCGMQVFPGCATATEAFTAIEAGATALKLFPANAFGPAYVRALRQVIPNSIQLYAVGGITPDNLIDYLQAGCVGAGLGTDLYRAGQTPMVTHTQAQRFITAYRQAMKMK